MSGLRVLYICHNHPDLHPGGTEIFAHELFREIKTLPRHEAMLLACTDQTHRARKPGTVFQAIGAAADECLIWTGHFDRFFLSQVDLQGIVPELTSLLTSYRPDVVHFHHTLLIGTEMLFLTKRVLPEARVVLTLHDYFPICANEGQMVRTRDMALCRRASADACHGCFPDIPPRRFHLREKHVKAMLTVVDRFVAPSRFLRNRYVEWGLEEERIEVIRNGRILRPAAPQRTISNSSRRDAFAYFGNLTPFKGVTVAVEAARLLAEAGETGFSLRIHGDASYQGEAFRKRLEMAVAGAAPQVAHFGGYGAEEMPDLIAEVDWVIVPSLWWENAPLVIQEAFQHRRPVICADIGGMAEAVRDGVDGLHFKAGGAASLMRTMARAIEEVGLWDRLVAGIPAVADIRECAEQHARLYAGLAGPAERAA